MTPCSVCSWRWPPGAIGAGARSLARRAGRWPAPPLAVELEAATLPAAGFATALGRLETAVARDRASIGGGRAQVGGARAAIDASASVVVVVDGTARCGSATSPPRRSSAVRHGDALVDAAVGELLERRRAGRAVSARVELFGPPLAHLRRSARTRRCGRRGQRHGAVALIEECTERRRLDQVRRDFVANISHELRTPVGPWPAGRDHRGRGRPGGGRPAVGAHGARRPTGGRHHRGPARAEPHRVRREASASEPVAVERVVAEAVERVRHAGRAARHQHRHAEPERPAGVIGDRRQLVSAVVNLVDNAREVTPTPARWSRSARRDGDAVAHRRSSTTASASRPATSTGSSSASTGSTGPAAAAPAAPAWGWRSSATWPPTTAARCACPVGGRARRPRFTLRAAGRARPADRRRGRPDDGGRERAMTHRVGGRGRGGLRRRPRRRAATRGLPRSQVARDGAEALDLFDAVAARPRAARRDAAQGVGHRRVPRAAQALARCRSSW